MGKRGKSVSFIRQKLKQLKKRLEFAMYCFPMGDNERFVRNVKNVGKENNLVYAEKYGECENTELVYHIKTEYSGSGFFADHNRLLGFLYFADKFGMQPVVEYHPDYCYAEKHPVNGTSNPFEYYFEQPTDVSLEQLYNCRHVVRSRKENGNYAIMLNEEANGYSRNEKYITEMGRITHKYLRLRPEVSEIINSEMQVLANSEEKVLGIHFRGTDFKRNYNGHPVNLTIEDYMEKIGDIMKKGYDKIFLATDDSNAVKRLQSVYGDILVYYKDVMRSDENETVMNSVSNRPNHHYMLGLEVLRDMYTLARCDGLIAGLSQVSIAARIQKKSYGKEYDDMIIIDKGINYHKKMNCPNG